MEASNDGKANSGASNKPFIPFLICSFCFAFNDFVFVLAGFHVISLTTTDFVTSCVKSD